MAEITEIDKALKKGDLTALPHWKIYIGDNAKTCPVAAASDNMPELASMPKESHTWGVTRPYFEQNLNLLPPGVYLIQFKKEPKDNNNIVSHIMTLAATGSHIGATPTLSTAQNNAGLTLPMFLETQQALFQAQMQNQFTMLKTSFEQKGLQDEIAALKKKLKQGSSAPVWLTEVIKIGVPMLQQALTGKAGAEINISGAGSESVPTPPKQEGTEFEEVSKEQADLLNKVHGETMQGFIDFFDGDEVEALINLHCVMLLLSDNPTMFEATIKPLLAPYRQKLKERGVDTDC